MTVGFVSVMVYFASVCVDFAKEAIGFVLSGGSFCTNVFLPFRQPIYIYSIIEKTNKKCITKNKIGRNTVKSL